MPITRTLTIIGEDGRTPFTISISDPQPCAGGHFSCAYAIEWPQKPWCGEALGYDGMQSLLVAMNFIAAHLYTSDSHRNGKLIWGGLGEGYGFPLSKSLRHLAIGDDRYI